MDIGIVVSVEADTLAEETVDLERAIRDAGHTPRRILVERLAVEVGGRTRLFEAIGGELKPLDVAAAFLRSIGLVRDFEQYAYRLWLLELLAQSFPIINNPARWAMARNKAASLVLLALSGLPTPWTFVTENFFAAYTAATRAGRTVVKPLLSSMGYGVRRLDDADEAAHFFSFLLNLNKPIYVQRYYEKVGGGDYRAIVVGGELLGAIFRKGRSWKSNVSLGATAEPAQLGNEVAELDVRAVEVLGLDYGGVDIALTSEGPLVMEVNPTMGWRGFKRATGLNPAPLLVRLLVDKVKK